MSDVDLNFSGKTTFWKNDLLQKIRIVWRAFYIQHPWVGCMLSRNALAYISTNWIFVSIFRLINWSSLLTAFPRFLHALSSHVGSYSITVVIWESQDGFLTDLEWLLSLVHFSPYFFLFLSKNLILSYPIKIKKHSIAICVFCEFCILWNAIQKNGTKHWENCSLTLQGKRRLCCPNSRNKT